MTDRCCRREFCPIRSVTDGILENIFNRLVNPADRNAVSMVCREWKEVDSICRKDVKIRNCYSLAPSTLSRRFRNLESLGIRGQSRAADFALMEETWGGYFRPWVEELARAYKDKIKGFCLRRMYVTDEDLRQVAEAFSNSLESLRLHKCFGGFSGLGLHHITSRCRSLKVLYLKGSEIQPSTIRGRWLSELAQKNHCLEDLNFQYFNNEVDRGLDVHIDDLEMLVDNCTSLRSLKVNWEVELSRMRPFLRRATSLTEFGTGHCADVPEGEQNMLTTADFPRSIVALSGLYCLSDFSVSFQREVLAGLKFLNLQHSSLTQKGLINILKHCVGLERLEVRNLLGDEGLITVAETCPDLKRIHIADNLTEEGNGYISPRGIIRILQGCSKLEHLVMYVADLDNATLAAVGKYCTFMTDCRFWLLGNCSEKADLRLDEGVKALLMGCQHLHRFILYLRHGALTDLGMAYIGMFGNRLKWVLLGCAGDSDKGLINLANGCRSLEKLEMIDCPISETGLAAAAICNPTLKFIWAQGQRVAEGRGQILARSRSNWVVETSLETQKPGVICAYHSVTKPRVDNPPEISIVVNDGSNLPILMNGGLAQALDKSAVLESGGFSPVCLATL